MKKKLLAITVILTMIVGILSGCGTENNKNKIGMVISTLDNPFFVSMKDGYKSLYLSFGYYESINKSN